MNKISISIIGSNSRLYNWLKPYLLRFFNIELEISHSDLGAYHEFINPLVFSLSPNYAENLKFLKEIHLKTKGLMFYVSSTAVLSLHYKGFYKYPDLKRKIELYLLTKENVKILRVGVPECFMDGFYGQVKVTRQKDFLAAVETSFKESGKIVNAFEQIYVNPINSISAFAIRLFKFLKRLNIPFHFFRGFDLVFKLLKLKNYGYSFLSNYHYSNTFKDILVGKGISALGVLDGYSKSGNLQNLAIIENVSRKSFVFDRNNSNFLEKNYKGGNSSLWHSVISNFNPNVTQSRRNSFLANFFSKIDFSPLFKGFSFIPYFPLRPAGRFPDNQIDDEVLLIETLSKLVVHCAKGSYECDRIILCTGSLSTLRILKNSNLIGREKLNISDHSVGIFGQVEFPRKVYIKNTIRSSKGHFKRHFKISCLKGRDMYLTIRPAYFGFKNVVYAENYRSFYANSTSSILFKLIKSLNPGLFLEAIYNKLGVQLFPSKKYNITGHIQTNGSVVFWPDLDMFEVITSSLNLSENEIGEIKRILSISFPYSTIKVRDDHVKVSPGMHFLSSNNEKSSIIKFFPQLANRNIFYSGSLQFEDNKIEHPTFDLYISGFDLGILLNNKS